ncbi:MAG: entericidin A/B family lipoprotein [Rhodospirillaceae bacterium]|nr:entericidin A/B family lipoprotein [Rhodospirillaceae bacterium]
MRTPHTRLIPAVLLAAAAALSGCNTIEGMGKDIKSGGKAIEKTAEDAKK